MKKDEAEQLIGRRFSAWTSANGVYIGVLKEVLSAKGKPWRGLIEITGVAQIACHFEVGRGVCRRGLRPGETMEVGGINLALTDDEGTDYKTALEASIAKHRADIAAFKAGKTPAMARFMASINDGLRAEETILAREIHRLKTGEWDNSIQRDASVEHSISL